MDRFQAGAGIQESEDKIVQKYLRLAELKSFEHVLNRFSTICVFLALFLQVVGLNSAMLTWNKIADTENARVPITMKMAS